MDEERIYAGSLKGDRDLLAPKEIKDLEDKRPSDWMDDSMFDDIESKKPDDWVEEKRIVDSEPKKPDDWDDEEDGEWEAPMKLIAEYKERVSGQSYLPSRVQGRLGGQADRQSRVCGR